MGIVRRLILLFYALAVLAALVVCAGVCLQLIPANVWQSELKYIITREETLAVLAVMAAASLILLTGVFSHSGSKGLSIASGDIHLEQGKPGEVKVTVPAVVDVVERTAVTVNGVRQANATVYQQSGEMPIRIRLVIVLGQGFSAPSVSEATVEAIDNALRTALELQNVPVEIKVNEITHAIQERDKRVV
ncbi:MAG: alkaline shock response membrane anchor protein AmaP [Selenomonadaceae bacterium]|nr:alkaline shock response membrane anchor protein AmaP [Selenomonadaceae bacterium]